MKNSVGRCIRKYEKQDGTVTYHAEVRRKNAKPIRGKFLTLTAAKNWVRKTESTLLDGQHVPDNKARKYTLSDLIEQYIRLHLSKFPSRLKDQTWHLNWWREHYGCKHLIQITPALLVEAKEKLLSEITHQNKRRTFSTVNRYFSTLGRAFTLAVQEWQWVHENPFRRVSKLQENGGRNRFLLREELQGFLQYCKASKNPHLYGTVLIAASMGLRFGEIINLRWQDIDLEHRFINLAKTKNGSPRYIPLPDQIAQYFHELPNPKPPESLIFPSKDPTKRHPYSLIRKAFQKALIEADLQDFKFHDLRHTAASHMAMNGATQSELMEVLGHRSPTMTRRYAHFSKEHLAKILQKTNNQLLSQTGEETT
jgi:integrase